MNNCGFDNWDLRPFFSGPDKEDYASYFLSIKEKIGKMLAASEEQICKPDLGAFIVEFENLQAGLQHLVCYIECVRSENIADEVSAQAQNNLDELVAQGRLVEVRLLDRLRRLSDAEFIELRQDGRLVGAEYQLDRLRYRAVHSMDVALESLAAELNLTGFRAWENLYENIAGSLSFTVTNSRGEERRVPMSLKVSLMEDPDRQVRSSTLRESNKAWEGSAHAVSAALNNIAGCRLKLQQRRKCRHFLDEASFESGLQRGTLEKMVDTVLKNIELPRRYLRLKAKLLGLSKLGFQDLGAPVNFAAYTHEEEATTTKIYTWKEAGRIIIEAFNRFDPAFAAFAKQALDNHWVESEVREGKRPGGFCTSSTLLGQSRIFMTFQGNLGDVFTLAHELGHAYHEYLMTGLRPWAHNYPMTLAETASTFAEALLSDYLISQPAMSRLEKLSMYQRRLDDAATYLLNIIMRFLFERSFYEKRSQKVLSAAELCRLMEETQQAVYGDALNENELDPWFWASKGHFYITEISFYNFPYTFGYLFSMGIYAQALQQGASFLPIFAKLLRLTGSASCEDTASLSLGADLTGSNFWESSLSLIERDFAAFEQLLKS
ncbi:MAG: M3 family oligoendopeptidase [Candidatus Bruticola sp.]